MGNVIYGGIQGQLDSMICTKCNHTKSQHDDYDPNRCQAWGCKCASFMPDPDELDRITSLMLNYYPH